MLHMDVSSCFGANFRTPYVCAVSGKAGNISPSYTETITITARLRSYFCTYVYSFLFFIEIHRSAFSVRLALFFISWCWPVCLI